MELLYQNIISELPESVRESSAYILTAITTKAQPCIEITRIGQIIYNDKLFPFSSIQHLLIKATCPHHYEMHNMLGLEEFIQAIVSARVPLHKLGPSFQVAVMNKTNKYPQRSFTRWVRVGNRLERIGSEILE